jgi:hypothetical protein
MNIRPVILLSLTSLVSFQLGGWTIEAQPLSPTPSLVTRLDPPSPAPAAVGAQIVSEVEKMVQSHADESVIKAFIQSWPNTYSLSADQILHLHDIGVSNDLLTTLIRRSAQLQAQATPMFAPGPMVPGGTNVPPPYADMTSTNPPPAYLYPYPGGDSTSSYSYFYPDATYPLYSSYYYPYPYYGYYGYPFWSYGFAFYSPYHCHYPYYRYWGYRPWYGHPGVYGRPYYYSHGGGFYRGGVSRGHR